MKLNKLVAIFIATLSLGLAACKITQPEVIEEYDENDTITVAQAIKYVNVLGVDNLSKRTNVKGVITAIRNTRDVYGYATFTISDPGVNNQFVCYQVKYVENKYFDQDDLIKLGDTVIISGRLVFFGGYEPQTESGGKAYIYSLNGKTRIDETKPQEEIRKLTIAEAISLIDSLNLNNSYSPNTYQIEGEVTRIISTADQVSKDGKASFGIKDATGSMTAFAIKNLDNKAFTDISEVPQPTAIVSILGRLTKFINSKGEPTYEIANGYIDKIVKEADPEAHDTIHVINPQEGDTLTVAQAILYAKQVGETLSEKPVFIKGVISTIASVSTAYGNATFNIKDPDADNQFTCFQVQYLENSKFTSADQIAIGDVVVIYGKVLHYLGVTPETEGKGATYIYSKNGETHLPAPQTYQVSIAQATEIIDNLESNEVSFDFYEISCTIEQINNSDAQIKQYGNVNLIIEDETGSMTAYRTYNIDNTKFNGLDEVPPVRSKVIIVGQLTKYNATYELVNCYIKEVVKMADPTLVFKTVPEALAIINGLQINEVTADKYAIEAIVHSVISTQDEVEANHTVDLWLRDEMGNMLQAVNTVYEEGQAPVLPQVGATIIINGNLTKTVQNEIETPQIINGSFVE